jgi:diguanylate cyclase (GGDEF)-like protein
MRSLPLAGKLGLLGFVLCALVVAGLSYIASLYAPIAQRSLDNAQAQTLADAAREAFEQWTLEDDQLNMYAGLVILHHSIHGKLTQKTIVEALDARRSVGPQLRAIERAASDRTSEKLLAVIRRDLAAYDRYMTHMLSLANRSDFAAAMRVQTIDNLEISNALTSEFRALAEHAVQLAGSANHDVAGIAALGAERVLQIAIVSLLLTVLVLTVVGRSITGPLRRLTIVAEKVAAGEVDVEADLPRTGSDEVGTLSGSFREMIFKRRRVEDQLAFAAFHDELTGLPNRALFMERVHEIAAKTRAEDLWAILFLDLDRFKIINDSLGHHVGDLVLIESARRVKECLRSGDMLARLGGDEFVVLLDNVEDVSVVCAVAGRILRAFEFAFAVDGHEVFAGSSIGIATSRNGDGVPDDVLRNADIAMYRAKQLGKQRYELFTSELLTRAVALHQTGTDLARALGRAEFELHYQPIVALSDGGLMGFEALVRWRHPRRGLVNPDEFIGLAEDTGAIVSIGEWILREACRQLQAWRARFPFAHDLRMNVNVSARQLASPGFANIVAGVLAASGLSSSSLNVEVTESVLVTDAEAGRLVLEQLRRLGVRIHLDDFGTGYSSLAYLHKFPIDALKIDRSFVSGTDVGESAAGLASIEIVRTIIALAQSLSLAVTAEGIETDEQREALRALGCTNAQGYYFSRAVDAHAADALIATHLNGVKGPPAQMLALRPA